MFIVQKILLKYMFSANNFDVYLSLYRLYKTLVTSEHILNVSCWKSGTKSRIIFRFRLLDSHDFTDWCFNKVSTFGFLLVMIFFIIHFLYLYDQKMKIE